MATLTPLLRAIVLIGIATAIVTCKTCHRMQMVGCRVVQTPEYLVQMQLTPNGTLASVTTVLSDIPVPVWSMLVRQIRIDGHKQNSKILFNKTYKVCEFLRYAKRIRMVNEIAENLLGNGNSNYSMTCPLRTGTYMIKFFSPPGDYMKLLYWPNTMYTIDGSVWSDVGKRQPMKNLCTYQINMTVSKLC